MKRKRFRKGFLTLLVTGAVAITGTRAAIAHNNETTELLDSLVNEEELIPTQVAANIGAVAYPIVEEISNYVEETNYYDDNTDLESYKQPVLRATTYVNIRKEPNTDCEILGLLGENETIRFTGSLNGWYEVLYNDQIAYINADYVKLDYDYVFPEEYNKLVYMNCDTTIYSSDNYSSPISTLLAYDSGEVYEETNGFYLVKTNDYAGYVPIENTTDLDDRVVVVDISSQKLSLYSDNKKQLSSDVVTGNPSTPTNIGLFTVTYKEKNATLEGPGYCRPVERWIPFDEDIGMHDASWRYGVFGGDIYTYNGSHGCVNMPLDAVSKVYDYVDAGTQVLVHK